MQYNEIISNGTLVYKSSLQDKKLREWHVEETTCVVNFYKSEPLTELDFIFLHLINSLENNKITKEEIGLTLGFNVAEREYGSKKYYRDSAEVALFNSMIDSVFKWNLVVEETEEKDAVNSETSSSLTEEEEAILSEKNEIKYIRLTRLGHKALEMNCKFCFYSGRKVLLENVNKSPLPEDTVDFPFYEALGLYTNISNIEEIKDYDPDKIDIDHSDELITRINLQSNSITNIFEAKKLKEWKYSVKYVDVNLYSYNGAFYPIVFNSNNISVQSTDILYREENSFLLNRKIKKALYYKLINNANSIINYDEIQLFEDEIEKEDFDIIIKDKRTDWQDEATFRYIATNEFCNETNWELISSLCPENIIISHLGESESKFELVTLSRRLPIPFIIDNCANYDWNLSVVLSRADVSKAQAQELMLCETNTNVEWDWDIIKPFLDIDFVVNNISRLNIDFYNLTSWLPKCNYDLIIKYCNKKWNWQLFANQADTNLIIDNMQILQDHVAVYMEIILDRLFTNSNIVNTIISNDSIATILKSIESKGFLISYNLSKKDNYAWSDELINYLEQCGILNWNTTDYVTGFAQYPFVKWNSDFFKKYYNKINSAYDFSYISEIIDNISLISDFPDFKWDWKALSRNTNFARSEQLLTLGKDKICYREWLGISTISLTSDFFASHNQWMRSESNSLFVSSSINDFNLVLEYDSYPWNWAALACNKSIANDERFCEKLNVHKEAIINWLSIVKPELIEKYFFKLRLSEHINNISETSNYFFEYSNKTKIWDRLSAHFSTKFIYQNIDENWNKDIITKRFIPVIEEEPNVLDNCKDNLNWNILSNELKVQFLQDYIGKYKDYWIWSILTDRLNPSFILLHFKEYLSLWNQRVAINKITPLLKTEDVIDPELNNVWDWYLISSKCSDDVIKDILVEKADYLDWNTISSRICKMQNCELASLMENNSVVSDRLNWSILNERMPLSVILENKDLQNALWNWTIITKRFDTEFIIDNLTKYAKYWDWNVILDEKLDRIYVKNNLERVKDSISSLDTKIKNDCWHTITLLYTPTELLPLSETYCPINGYEWDYSHIYKALTDPESFVNKQHSYIDYKAFSGCDAVNEMFMYDSESYVYRTWKTIVKAKLHNDIFKWDFSELTKLESIQQRHEVFYEIKTDCWDWNYISQFGTCLLPEHKGKYMRKYRNRLNFSLISVREDIMLDDDMIQSFIDEKWDWAALSANQGTNITFNFIFNNREKKWDWCALSKNSTIKWVDAKLPELLKDSEIKTSISWDDVVAKKELHFDDSILDLMSGINFSWLALTSNLSFIPSVKTIKNAIIENADINWSALSKNQHLDQSFVREFKNYLDWTLLTTNTKVLDITKDNIVDEFIDYLDWTYVSKKIQLTTEKLVKYKDFLDWNTINKRFDYNELDISLIESIQDFIDWKKLSSASIVFTEEFLHQFRSRIDWFAFSKNESVDFTADLYKDFVKELNRVEFLETLSNCSCYQYNKLKVYHFSHMFNAIDIIKNRKILSRNKAEATKKLKYDAAGAVVHRTNKAHPYARFYYRPKSPTQFYNECLGWDNTLLTNWRKPKSYYPQACELHLPKCPMPVFFEFDIQEIIAKMPEKCYYSSGNLQTNFASVYKVDDNPNKIRTEYLYNDISDAFNMACSSGTYDQGLHHMYMSKIKEQSQQEFLVYDELDFTKLDSIRIYCYDDFQKNLLIHYLGDDELVSKIEVNSMMYSYDKRSLDMSENEDTITISSDYDLGGCAYILVKGGSIVNKDSIKNVTSIGTIIYPMVTFEKNNPPSEIYLMDPHPRADTKQWLIFKP